MKTFQSQDTFKLDPRKSEVSGKFLEGRYDVFLTLCATEEEVPISICAQTKERCPGRLVTE